jgi:hypothetical protein
MNGGPIIWGFAIAIFTISLRKILVRVENGDTVLPKLSSVSRLWGGGLNGTTSEEKEALIVTIRLCSGEMGDKDERGRIAALQHQLSDAIENSSAGELDGDEYGGGTCTIYMYGSSAERLLSVTWPILKEFRAPSGSYVIKRCGSAGREERRISLDGA